MSHWKRTPAICNPCSISARHQPGCTTRESLQFLAVNDAAVRTYGYSRPAFLTMNLHDIACAPGGTETEASLDPVSSHHAETIHRYRTADGHALFVETATQSVNYAGRNACLVVARDVTMLRRAIGAVEASERRFRDLFEHSVGLICTHDMDGGILRLR